MDAIRIETGSEGVVFVVLDVPGKRVNTLSPGLMEEFEAKVLPLLADEGCRALVLASGKPGTFIAGADLEVLGGVETPEEASAFSREGNRILSALAQSSKPVVAAVWGAALGGGLEVALACHRIVAAKHPDTLLGLPEVQLGLLPAGGGTQRLSRRIGLLQGLRLLLSGERVRVIEGFFMGLVDEAAKPEEVRERAAELALKLAADEGLQAPQYRILRDRLAELPGIRDLVLRQARRKVLARTRGHYPAPLAILSCVRVGLRKGMEAGLAREAKEFGKLAVSRPARNLIWLFQAGNELKKLPSEVAPRPVTRLGIVGGGFMGTGIASVSLGLCPVVIRDVSEEALSKARGFIHEGFRKLYDGGAITGEELDRRHANFHLTTELKDLQGADLVIEAVFEDLELKRRVFAELEEVVSPEAVLASNTSALPIGEIAAQARHPERILGMHYFSPVHKMPLLEIIAAPRTADWAVATARAFGVAQGKTVIVVKDGPGFYTSRILAPYMNEAILLLEEGARIEDLDRAMKDWGFPVGPVTLLDEVGIDVAAHVSRDLGRAFAHRGLAPTGTLQTLAEAGYHGRKSRRGFYRYTPEGKKARRQPNREMYRFFGGARRRTFPRQEIQERMALAMINEAVYCLGEGILGSPRDGDVGAVLGLGFPPFTGGPFHYLDHEGIGAVVDRLHRLAERHGPRFAPAPLFQERVRRGEGFYPSGG